METSKSQDLSGKLSQETRQSLCELGDQFLREFLEVETSRHPDNVDALAELGQIYTRLGLWELGLDVDQRLVRLIPDNPTSHYNLGCSLALLGHSDEALDSLECAVALGYDDAVFLQGDEDLVSLREHRRFRAIVERLRSKP